jgi:cell division protein FtsN
MGQKKKPRKTDGITRTKARPMGVFGWLWTVFFVSAGMFVVGILVGRGTAPIRFDIEALQKELAALKAQALKAEVQRYRIDPKDDGPRGGIEFHEALKTPYPRTEKLKLSPPPKRKPTAPVTPKPAAVASPPVVTPAGKPPLPSAADAAAPMTLQVASLKEKASADRIVAALVRKGFPAVRVAADVPGKGRWHRVQVGRFQDRADAASTMKQLEQEGRPAILVAR